MSDLFCHISRTIRKHCLSHSCIFNPTIVFSASEHRLFSAGWRNPAVANVPAFGDATGGAYIECSASSVQGDSQPVSAVCGRETVRCVTESQPNQWMQIKVCVGYV